MGDMDPSLKVTVKCTCACHVTFCDKSDPLPKANTEPTDRDFPLISAKKKTPFEFSSDSLFPQPNFGHPNILRVKFAWVLPYNISGMIFWGFLFSIF